MVDLLLKNGADPLLTDDQGFNLLHSATLDGNVFQIALLLHQDIAVDVPDAQGHTSLMWASYKGFPQCIDLLLRWGGNVYARDAQGFTALHWALVKGQQHGIFKLIEYGSDRFAETNEGKSPATVAKEMNSARQYQSALRECGYNPDGSAQSFPLSSFIKERKPFYWKVYYFYPTIALGIVLYITSYLPIFLGLPLAALVSYGIQVGAQKFLKWAPTDMKIMNKTVSYPRISDKTTTDGAQPFLSGVFFASLFWVGTRWLTTVMPYTLSSNFFLNLFFITSYSLCGYFYFRTMLEDPGYVPKPGSRSGQKAAIDELLEARQFDEQHFCVTCMVRRPLRSKHCKRCGRCVAKQDQYVSSVFSCKSTADRPVIVRGSTTAWRTTITAILRCTSSRLVVASRRLFC